MHIIMVDFHKSRERCNVQYNKQKKIENMRA